MAVKNRGLRKEIGGFYDQFEIEIIQRETASWCPESPAFSGWISVLDAADTGERSGLSQSTWGPDGGDVPANLLGEEGLFENAVPLPRLTYSAKQYARMMRAGMPEMPVHSGAEKRKFAAELNPNLFVPGDPMGRLQQHQRVNFDAWAVEWNLYCGKIESGLAEWEPVYRKTSKQLQAYYEKFKQRANATVTMLPIRHHHVELRTTLQEPAGGAIFANSVGNVVPTPTPRIRSGVDFGGSGGEGAAGDAEMIDVGGNEGGSSAGAIGVDGSEPIQKKTRRAQMCQVCGHCKQRGAFKAMHTHPRKKPLEGGSQCQVPVEQRRPDECRIGNRRAAAERRTFSPCDCAGCTQPVPS